VRKFIPADGSFTITEKTSIVSAPRWEADFLAAALRRATGFPVPVVRTSESTGNIVFGVLGHGDAADEGYVLDITANTVNLSAHYPAGYFYGVQTLRQMLPPQIESTTATRADWNLPVGHVEDAPRFPWRGAMLDVSRHFFDVDSVKRYVDHISMYKLNRLHLHLSDDQGWRIAIAKWPKLTEIGGSSQVGRGKGGFYTKADYKQIVDYAAQRHVTVVPEIDMPGHTNAALSSYGELNCSGKTTRPYRGMEVGFSSLCMTSEATWRFVDDVISEWAGMTPGSYIHIGGDEVEKLSTKAYAGFVKRAAASVTANQKSPVGWAEIGKAELPPGALVQYWNTGGSADVVREAAGRGARVIMSPASKSYLDMKYDSGTKLGLDWAGTFDVKDAWDWDPATLVDGVGADSIEGVEAPLWTETLDTIDELESMAFPRLPAIAEIGWGSPQGRDWEDFRKRLAAQAPRWKLLGVDFYPSTQIDWEK
jgi:hexosaminidase